MHRHTSNSQLIVCICCAVHCFFLSTWQSKVGDFPPTPLTLSYVCESGFSASLYVSVAIDVRYAALLFPAHRLLSVFQLHMLNKCCSTDVVQGIGAVTLFPPSVVEYILILLTCCFQCVSLFIVCVVLDFLLRMVCLHDSSIKYIK